MRARVWDRAIERALEHYLPKVHEILEEYGYLKDLAKMVRKAKEEVVKNFDYYIELAMKSVEKNGGRAYLASNAEEARRIVGGIVGSGKVVVFSKSTVLGEIELRTYLEKLGNEVWETDLGEFIVQLAGDRPSHIITPALHLTKEDVAEIFRERLNVEVKGASHEELAAVAREFLRDKILRAKVCVSGANAVAADTGAVVLVENESNIRLITSLSDVHVVVTGIEKILPTLYDALAEALVQASCAGSYPPTYINVVAGPSSTSDIEKKRVVPAQGPKEFHVVFLDNGRRRAAEDDVLREVLYCIRCGRCHMYCPVYRILDGTWGESPYSGPMGVAWSSIIYGVEKAGKHAVLCAHAGNCKDVCPMEINLPEVIRRIKVDYLRILARS